MGVVRVTSSLAVVILVWPGSSHSNILGLTFRKCSADTQYMSVTKMSLKVSAAPSVVKKHLERTNLLLLARTLLENLRR